MLNGFFYKVELNNKVKELTVKQVISRAKAFGLLLDKIESLDEDFKALDLSVKHDIDEILNFDHPEDDSEKEDQELFIEDTFYQALELINEYFNFNI